MELNTPLDMPAAVYHSLDRLSASGAKKLLHSPAKYLASRQEASKATPAMAFGTMFHALILEPALFARTYTHQGPSMAGIRTKDGKDAKNPAGTEEGKARIAQWEADNPGMSIVPVADWDRAHRMRASMERRGLLEEFTDGMAEASVLWDIDSVPCKSRIDFLRHDGCADLKTCADISDDGIARSALNFGYSTQVAAYMEASAMTGRGRGFVFVFCETEAPYQCVLKTPDPQFIGHGQREWDRAVELYRACTETGDWYGVERTASPTLSLPGWVLAQHERAERATGAIAPDINAARAMLEAAGLEAA